MIDIVFERDSDQKYFRDGNEGLALAKSITNKVQYDDYKTTIHFHWRVPKAFGRKQALPIKAALATQNLDNCNVLLWSNVDLSGNEYVKPLLPYIENCHYAADEQAVGTPLQGAPLLSAKDNECFLDGDLFRLLILYKYGGVYCDMDMVLLRDLAPLLSQEFMYQWGTETYDSTQATRINGAIMRMFHHSQLAYDCLTEIPRGPGGAGTTDWGSVLYGRVREKNKNWTIFPCAFFNTEWQLYVNMGESGHPFRATSGEVSDYDGAFAWHWHNKWLDKIEPGCKWERIEKRIDELFKKKFDEKEYRFDYKNVHLGGNIAGGDNASWTPELWFYLKEEFGIKTMMDVGCGEGQSVRWWEEHDVYACGFDGIPINIERSPTSCFLHDLTVQPIRRTVDLVTACEVVEHIDEKHIDKLMATLTSGDVVAITFAPPGQGGFHHVNCQDQEYWIGMFDKYGYSMSERHTIIGRRLAGENTHFSRTGLVFIKNASV